MKISPDEISYYQRAMRGLREAQVPCLVGGAYALWKYTGNRRPTKDLDLFLRPKDLSRALEVMRALGFRTEVTARHWLGKAFYRNYLIDFILGMANGVAQVDDSWFQHATSRHLFGQPSRLLGPEDMIWSKAFVMERNRFDGADIAHMILDHGKSMDWDLLLRRFRSHAPVLLSHVVLFRYIYPHAQAHVPPAVVRRLMAASRCNGAQLPPRLCRGTYFSRTQYTADVARRKYQDARLLPFGVLTAQQTLE